MPMANKPKPTIIDKNGVTIKFHANGQTIWSKGKVVAGFPEGYWQWFRVDGTLKRSGYFAKGNPVGVWTTYNSEGKPYKLTKKEKNNGKK